MENSNPLEYVSRIQDLQDLSDFMEDDDLTEAMGLVVKMIVDGHPTNSAKVTALMTRLSAYSAKFRLLFATYMTFKKGTKDAAMKKNIYRYAYEGLDEIIASLKYLAR